MRKITVLLITGILALLLIGGCASKDETSKASSSKAGKQASAEKKQSEKIGGFARKLTAKEVIDAFKKAKLPVGEVQIYNAETDPNSLLGRPGQYVGKGSWADTRAQERKGGTVEVFDSSETLQKRKKFISSFSGNPGYAQYMYEHLNVLVRINKELYPSEAAEYEKALVKLK